MILTFSGKREPPIGGIGPDLLISLSPSICLSYSGGYPYPELRPEIPQESPVFTVLERSGRLRGAGRTQNRGNH